LGGVDVWECRVTAASEFIGCCGRPVTALLSCYDWRRRRCLRQRNSLNS
jgi:hypothetical protein